MTEADRDALKSYDFACLCLAEQVKAGRKLTPREMVERVDRRQREEKAP